MKLLSFLAIVSSLLVVSAPSTVLSIIWLVAVFLLTALILALLGLTYASLTYVIVYVGAIAILFLFVVQLLDQRDETLVLPDYATKERYPSIFRDSNLIFTLILGTLILWEISTSIPFGKTNTTSEADPFKWNFIDFLGNTLLRPITDNEDSLLYGLNSTKDMIYTGISKGYVSIEQALYTSNQIQNLGEWFYGGASLPLLIISVILLLSMVGPIVICWKTNS